MNDDTYHNISVAVGMNRINTHTDHVWINLYVS
jgi:hypothetical protein